MSPYPSNWPQFCSSGLRSAIADRFSFNGQERTVEIAGSGNHNTALFWEYDTRLGRRWNLDPVVKPWQSDYICFSDNPIFRIDPNGDDDYFDQNGNFKFSFNKNSDIIYIKNSEGIYVDILKYQFNLQNIKALVNVCNYYIQQLGLPLESLAGGSISVAQIQVQKNENGEWGYYQVSLHNNGIAGELELMHYSPRNNTINITLDTGGKIDPLLGTASNIKSTLRHEFLHKTFPGADYDTHLKVYYGQLNAPEFKNTTPAFKKNAFDIIESYYYKLQTYNNNKLTLRHIESIRTQGNVWENKFRKIFERYEKSK